MIASNENKSIYVTRTPCGRMIFMRIGGVALWLTDDDFASLAGVVRKTLDSMMDGFLSGINDDLMFDPARKDNPDDSRDDLNEKQG